MTSPLDWTARKLISYPPRSKPAGYNPRACGVILQGSTTDVVLQLLCARPAGRWTSNHVIEAAVLAKVGRAAGTVRWALVYLRQLNLVEASGDNRNARYLRYRVTPKGMELKR